MDRPGKAALLSALVFPGAGHLYLRRYLRGCLLLLLGLAPLYYLVVTVLQITRDLADRIAAGELAPDLLYLFQLVNDALAQSGRWLNVAMLAFALVWGIAILDAHRLGKEQGSS